MEVEAQAPSAALTGRPIPNIPGARERHIQELFSKVEGKLPNVAEARQELQALRIVLQLQLRDAAALSSDFPLTALNDRHSDQFAS